MKVRNPNCDTFDDPSHRALLTRPLVTERARKLRAQYALQAQGLRARLEMRVNRIPQALRMTNIKQLVEKHSEQPKPEPPSRAIDAPVRHPDVIVSPPKERTLKRTRYANADESLYIHVTADILPQRCTGSGG